MNKTVYEPYYIDGSCDPGFKPKDQNENQNNNNSEVLNERRKRNNMERYSRL